MDALSDVLRVVGLTGGVFLEARFTAPWCIVGNMGPDGCRPFMAPPAHLVPLHYVAEGECVVALDGEAPVTLAAGDVVLLPRNEIHKLGSSLGIRAVPSDSLVQPPDGAGVVRIDHGGGGAVCRIVCGFLAGDRELEPLIATLPPLMKMHVEGTPGGEWISHAFSYGARALASGDPGTATIMAKMSELLFVEAVRRYLATLPKERTGFLAGLRDPAIGKALAIMHSQVAKPWTVEALAEAVGQSRSAFAERFGAVIGVPPLTYLTNWRMQVAAHKLREGRLSIGQIAFDIGYESEAAFTRAFKREHGAPPAAWRKRALSSPA